MQYKVEVYSKYCDILLDITFDNKCETALHLWRIITHSRVSMRIQVQKIYLTRNDKRALNVIIYRLYEYE
jgi:hypothetical protein